MSTTHHAQKPRPRNRTRPLAAILTGLMLSVATLGATAQEAVSLRPQWTPGQTARYEFWHERTQNETAAFGPNTQKASSQIITEGQMTWAVEKINADGSARCAMTIDWITARLVSPEGTQDNDSRKGSGDTEPIHKLLKAMAGVPLAYTVNADGSIDSVKGVKAMRRAIGKDLEGLIPEDLDFIESAAELATLPYAPATLAPGGTYKAEYRWTHDMGHMDQRWTYTLASIDDMDGIPVATVTGTGKLKLDVDTSQIPPDAPPIDVKMPHASAATQVFFDLDRHEAVGRHSTDDTTIVVSMTLPDGRGRFIRTIEQTNQGQILRLSEH